MPSDFIAKSKGQRHYSRAFIHAWLDDLKDRVTDRMEAGGSLKRVVRHLQHMEAHLRNRQRRFDADDDRIAREGLEEVNATSQARNYAQANGIDISQVTPADGKRIKKSDVEAVIGLGAVQSGTEVVQAEAAE